MPEELLSVKSALEQILSHIHPVGFEQISIEHALNRILAHPVTAPYDLPLFNNSSMDGFAVRFEDISNASSEHPVKLRVIADIPAGVDTNVVIQSGQAARIMTGAVLPKLANAVVPVEETDFNERRPGTEPPKYVNIYNSVGLNAYIRPKGEDVTAGDVVLQHNQRLRAQEVGFLAMLGVSNISVYSKPRVALISSGDELLRVGETVKPGKIYDANSYTLASLVQIYGGSPLNFGITADQEVDVKFQLENAVHMGVDLIVSSAGVSVGAFDFIRKVVEEEGKLTFWRVNMRPGKPFAFGSYKSIPFVGLPGNPVSAFIGFEVFIRPALLKMAGMKRVDRTKIKVNTVEPISSDGRESYLRAIIFERDGQLLARLTGHQGSGNLRSLVQANALLIIPSEVKFVPAETELFAWMIGE